MAEVMEREVFVREYPLYELAGVEYEVKPSSAFSFNDMTELGKVQDEATELLEEARREDALNEDGDVDTTNSKYALRIIEINLKRLVIHLQNMVDVDYLKELGADEIRDFEDFLSNEDEVKEESRKQKQDQLKQKRLIRQKKEIWVGMIRSVGMVSKAYCTSLGEVKAMDYNEVLLWFSYIDSFEAHDSLRLINNLQVGGGFIEPKDRSQAIKEIQEIQARIFPKNEELEKRKAEMISKLMGTGLPIGHLMSGVVQAGEKLTKKIGGGK